MTHALDSTADSTPAVLLDAHVHLHPRFSVADWLASARQNLDRAAARLDVDPPVLGCLWLVDTVADRGYARLAQLADAARTTGEWTIARTAEPMSLLARHESGELLVLLAGRQLATRERLEVLALGRDADYPTGLSLAEAIAAVRESGALAVVPWGFGKWWLARGRLLAATLAASPSGGLFVGDNGGRPRFVPRSAIFEQAAARGIFNLPGSDPLPLAWEVRKPGRLGCVLDGGLDLDRPAADLMGRLGTIASQPRTFGAPETLAGFVRSQTGLRMRTA